MKIVLDTCFISVVDVMTMTILEVEQSEEPTYEEVEIEPQQSWTIFQVLWYHMVKFFKGPQYEIIESESSPTRLWRLQIDYHDEHSNHMTYASTSEDFTILRNRFDKVVALMGYEKFAWGYDKSTWM